MTETEYPDHIALIAGQGDFPRLVASSARAHGVRVTIIALKTFAKEDLQEWADEIHWLALGQLQKAIDLMHAVGTKHLIMVGRVPHNSIFQYRHFDLRAMKLLGKMANKRADGLLQAVTDEFASEGITVVDSSMFIKSLMPGPGLLNDETPPSAAVEADIHFGYPLAKAVAGLDIGQTIVVKDRMVVAVEGAEGTDECILRAGELAGPGSVVIKVSKPQQDLRYDIPIIGPDTVNTMTRAGCSALALSAGRSLVFHREEVKRMALESGITIKFIDDQTS